MNATAPIQTARPGVTASPSANAASSNSTKAADNGPSFAGALNAAAAKPARKSPAVKDSASQQGGGALPVSGNHAPPPALAPQLRLQPAATLPLPATSNGSGAATDDLGSETVGAIAAGPQAGARSSATASAAASADGVEAGGPAGDASGSAGSVGAGKLAGAFADLLGAPASGPNGPDGAEPPAAAAAAETAAALSSAAPASAANQGLELPASATSAALSMTPASASPRSAAADALSSSTTEASGGSSASPAPDAATGSLPPPAPPRLSSTASTTASTAAITEISAAAAKSAATPPAPVSNVLAAPGTAANAASSLNGSAAASASVGNTAAPPVPPAPVINAALAEASGFGAGAAITAAVAAASPESSSTASDESDDVDAANVGAPGLGQGLGVAGFPGVAGVPDAPAPAPAATLALATAAADLLSGQSSATGTGTGDTDKRSRAIDAALPGSDAAAGLSQLSSNSAPEAPTVAPTLRVAASVDGADFPQALSDRVSWMVDNGLNGARLQVNPPQLGPIELRIAVQGDHAQVSMITHSEVTRAALESSSPTLREMLGGQGFGQVSVDISQRSFQDRPPYSQPYAPSSTAGQGAAGSDTLSAISGSSPRTSSGALDAYA